MKAQLAGGADPTSPSRSRHSLWPPLPARPSKPTPVLGCKRLRPRALPPPRRRSPDGFRGACSRIPARCRIPALTSRGILACLQRIEARGALDSAHRVKQICGQVFRFAVAAGLADRDVTAPLKGALSGRRSGTMLRLPSRAKWRSSCARSTATAASPMPLPRSSCPPYSSYDLGSCAVPSGLRSTSDNAEWRIPDAKMKMKTDHIVTLSRQALEILRPLHPMTGHGRFVFPSVRTDDRCMSENTVEHRRRSPSKHGLPEGGHVGARFPGDGADNSG